jgi:hypothetical protein
VVAGIPSSAADEAAQQQANQQLRAAIAAYEQLRKERSEELRLFTQACEEEAAMVFDFLTKLSWQLAQSERHLTGLLQELREHTAVAQGTAAAAARLYAGSCLLLGTR